MTQTSILKKSKLFLTELTATHPRATNILFHIYFDVDTITISTEHSFNEPQTTIAHISDVSWDTLDELWDIIASTVERWIAKQNWIGNDV